jgi:glycosyltransferase involved in cell wall biosynthesis
LSYRGVKFKDIHAPKIVGVESALHTLLSVFYAKRQHADLLHIHAIGPAIVLPVAKLLRLKVVVTHHGPDYDRKKWGWLARYIIKTGERFTARFADDVIAVSPVIVDIMKKKYGRTHRVHLIYNGVNIPPLVAPGSCLARLGLSPQHYVLAVGRFVEEKNFDHLIDAFHKIHPSAPCRLAIAGDADIETAYSQELKAKAKAQGVVLAGIVKGRELAELYSNAALFVLPSSHEGLPLTLLEAMSYRRKVVVSDIPANLAVGLDKASYFHLDDWDSLAERITERLNEPNTERTYDLSRYDWDTITTEIVRVYAQQ